ncbi:hypothetical protein [Streptomyces sp. AC512_CC834]|uniref:hypothetical protein n=1 Tax=Streptomyces sp. AC512_CC834 TaxID=2823691 RepID=UPI001C2610CC|nr:hypothetical protein [Streptomyces sp. AC512_CC834]
MTPIRVRIGVLGLALVAGLAAPTTATAATATPPAGTAPAPTVEERRRTALPTELERTSHRQSNLPLPHTGHGKGGGRCMSMCCSPASTVPED